MKSALNHSLRTLLLVLFGILLCPIASAQERVLVLGAIHPNLEGRYAELRPMADYVAAALAEFGVTRVDVMVVEDRRRLARMLRDGRIDWISEDVANTVYLQEAAGVHILARKWLQGAPQFRTVFFARADGDVNSLADLSGRTLAFGEQDSIAGHLLPAAELIRAGHRTVVLETPRQQAPPGTIGYAFAGGDLNATTWVHKRLADAGVLSNVDWDSDSSLPEFFRKDFVIFHQTDSMPRALELVRGDLDPELKDALRQTLLAMDKDSSAARALQAYQGTLRFDELADDDHQTLRKLRSTFAQLMLVN